jgi:bifunctional ADP-heptose synthase (sugar kinase/adenylyltransferase)
MKSSKNYYWIRERADSTVEWLRPGALAKDIARPLVLVLGTWDLLHFGHMRVLFAAREKATDQGTVICGMYSD